VTATRCARCAAPINGAFGEDTNAGEILCGECLARSARKARVVAIGIGAALLIAVPSVLFAVGGGRLAAKGMDVLAIVSACIVFLIRRRVREQFRRTGAAEPVEWRLLPWLLASGVVLLLLRAVLGLGPWS
jgi:hypothetical protein